MFGLGVLLCNYNEFDVSRGRSALPWRPWDLLVAQRAVRSAPNGSLT